MADEEVRIRVVQESEGNALKEAIRDAGELEKTSRNSGRVRASEALGSAEGREAARRALGFKSAATDIPGAKAQASQQVESNSLAAAAARAKKEAALAEIEAAKQAKAAAAIAKGQEAARERMAQGILRTGSAVSGKLGGGGVPGGGLIGKIPAAAVAASVVAIGAGIADAFMEQAREVEQISGRDNTSRAVDRRRRQRLAGFEGTASGARNDAESAKDERIQREADRQRLQDKAKVRLLHPMSWLDKLTGKSQNEINENENAITRLREDEVKSREIQKEQFKAIGAKELAAREKRLKGDRVGARELEHDVLREKEFRRLMGETSDKGLSERGADIAVRERIREEQQKFAGLVNARRGAGDVARAAALASGQMRGNWGGRELEALHDTVRSQHRESMNPGTDFFTR